MANSVCPDQTARVYLVCSALSVLTLIDLVVDNQRFAYLYLDSLEPIAS